MSDPRLSALGSFTPTSHSKVPSKLDPSLQQLKDTFVVCIIGASEGIGEHIAYAYAHAGASAIIIAARRVPNLEPVRERLQNINPQVTVETHGCDIASAASVEALAKFVEAKFSRLDCLIANAAYSPPVTLKMHLGEPAGVQQAFNVNAMGTYHAAHYFLPLLLRSNKGAKQFIAVSSFAAAIRRGIIANMAYCVSKLAQVRMIEYLDEQYSDQGLLAVGVHPGAVLTSMAAGNTPEEFMPYLTDAVDLCGAFLVWLSRQATELKWLSGRLISANWDVDELVAQKECIIQQDLLKAAIQL